MEREGEAVPGKESLGCATGLKESPPKSLSTQATHVARLASSREQAHELVRRYDEEAIWDAIQAKDVDPGITEHVLTELEKGVLPRAVMRQLGIYSTTDKRWKKILASVRQGCRIDSMGLFLKATRQMAGMADKLNELLERALEDGVPAFDKEGKPIRDKDGHIEKMPALTKEIAACMDSYGKLQSGIVKMGKDLGVFTDPSENAKGGGGQGVQINVFNNVPLPDEKDIRAKQQAIEAKYRDMRASADAAKPET